LPDSIISIEDRALYQCSKVTSVTIPNGLENIGRSAFYRCTELQEIYLPASVSQIGYQAFTACPALKEIEVDADNPFYTSFDGVLYDKSMSALIQCPAGRGGAFSIPDGVSSIQDYAFYECNLTSLIVPSSVATIKYRGFDYMMSLTQIYFLGDAPLCDDYWIDDWNESLKIFYSQGRSGFTSPTWYGIETVALVSIVGKVIDNEGSGIAGVKVTLDDNLWVITGSDGNFTILTSVGNHNLTFSGSGLKNRTMDIDVSESGLVLSDVEMDTIGDDSDGDSNDTWLIAAVAGIIAVAVGSIGYLWWRKNKK